MGKSHSFTVHFTPFPPSCSTLRPTQPSALPLCHAYRRDLPLSAEQRVAPGYCELVHARPFHRQPKPSEAARRLHALLGHLRMRSPSCNEQAEYA
eukprot:6180276-Pleurochrysis_carterae.AAC.2